MVSRPAKYGARGREVIDFVQDKGAANGGTKIVVDFVDPLGFTRGVGCEGVMSF